MAGAKDKRINPMPVVDEGWWASVLAEEKRFPPPINRPAGNKTGVEEVARGGSRERKADVNWEEVKDLFLGDRIVDLTVTGFNRGGLLVGGGEISGFVPFSHLVGANSQPDAAERDRELEAYVGRRLRLKVIECVPEDGRVVFSERAALTEPGRRAELFHSLHAGQTVRGVVTNVTDFGVFVDLGGVEGLIHISELSWGRVSHPSDLVELGSTIEVQVLDFSPERCRVALSLKRLLSNPWLNAPVDFPEGSTHSAVITKVLSYGAFARLDHAGVEGLIHVSEIPQADGKPLKEVLRERDAVRVRVLHLDPAHHRLGFSMKLE
jgi:small subunit ribosomal protein S1